MGNKWTIMNIIYVGIVLFGIIHFLYKDVCLRLYNGYPFDWDMVGDFIFICVLGTLLIPQKHIKLKQKILLFFAVTYIFAALLAIQ